MKRRYQNKLNNKNLTNATHITTFTKLFLLIDFLASLYNTFFYILIYIYFILLFI